MWKIVILRLPGIFSSVFLNSDGKQMEDRIMLSQWSFNTTNTKLSVMTL